MHKKQRIDTEYRNNLNSYNTFKPTFIDKGNFLMWNVFM